MNSTTQHQRDSFIQKMSGAHVLKLQSYKGRELTEHEVALQQFFDSRDDEHRRQLEKKQRKSSLLVNDFYQVLSFLCVYIWVYFSVSLM